MIKLNTYITEKLHLNKDIKPIGPTDLKNKDDVYEYVKSLGYKVEVTGKSKERGGVWAFSIEYNDRFYLTMSFWEKDKFAWGYYSNIKNQFIYQQDCLISVEQINEIGWDTFLLPEKYLEYLKEKKIVSKNEKYLIKELSKLI